MILVFFLLGLLVMLLFISCILLFSSIRIKIENIKINNFKLNKDYKIYIQLYFFNKIKIFSRKLNTNKERLKSRNDRKKIIKLFNKINNNKFSSKNNLKMKFEILTELFNLKLKLEKIKLFIEIGYEDASILPIITSLLNSIVSIILLKMNAVKKDTKYFIKPNYNNNKLKICLDSIISVKVVHIIYVMCKIIKKGRIKDERTSNRRINAVQL